MPFKKYLPLFVVCFAAVLLFYNIDKPFIGHHDWNGAFWGDIVRKYLTYLGLLDSHYAQDPAFGTKSLVYYNYTPLLPLIFTIPSAILGLSELTLRLTTVFFSLVMIFFIYKIGEFLFNKTAGLLAAIFAALTPMFIYFGKMPDHEPILTALVTITFFFFVKSHFSKSAKKYTFLFFMFLVLSLLESWPAFFLVLPLAAFSYFVGKQKLSIATLPILIAVLVILFHVSMLFAITGESSISQFIENGLNRIDSKNDLIGGFANYSPKNFAKTEARYATIYFTKTMLLLSAAWLLTLMLRARKEKLQKKELSLLILLIYPLTFILAFRPLAFIHDYKLYHFLPFLALSSAVFINQTTAKLTNRFAKAAQLILVLIIVQVATERSAYLKTLLKTSFNTPGYELGNLINQKTEPAEKVLVNSNQFGAFFEVFVTYYSDRNVNYQDLTLEQFLKNSKKYDDYKYIILVDERTVDSSFEKHLDTNLKKDKQGPYSFYSNK